MNSKTPLSDLYAQLESKKRRNDRIGWLVISLFGAFLGMIFGFGLPKAHATGNPAPTGGGSPSDYPITCSDAAGNVTLVADGRKIRLAYWEGDTPYFTDARRAAKHKRTFAAPAGSTCRKA